MNELNDVDMLFLKSIIEDVPDGKEHRFSFRYKLRKRKILSLSKEKKPSRSYVKPSLRIKYIILAIIVATIAILTGLSIGEIFEGYRITDYDIYSLLYIVDDTPSDVSTVEKKAYIDVDADEYEVNVIDDTDTCYFLEYRRDNYMITICQIPIAVYGQQRINKEFVIGEAETVSINGWNGLCFEMKGNRLYYAFNTGDYLITYVSNMPKQEAEKMVQMTKFQEKM